MGTATAGSRLRIRCRDIAGANCVHGCAIGIGERVGNTQIDQMLVNLKLMGIAPLGYAGPEQAEAILPGGIARDGRADSGELSRRRRGCVPHCDRRYAAAVIKAFRKMTSSWRIPFTRVCRRIFFGLEQIIDIGPMSGRSNVLFGWSGADSSFDELVDINFSEGQVSDHTFERCEVVNVCQLLLKQNLT